MGTGFASRRTKKQSAKRIVHSVEKLKFVALIQALCAKRHARCFIFRGNPLLSDHIETTRKQTISGWKIVRHPNSKTHRL
jgi:hypothetical protein